MERFLLGFFTAAALNTIEADQRWLHALLGRFQVQGGRLAVRAAHAPHVPIGHVVASREFLDSLEARALAA